MKKKICTKCNIEKEIGEFSLKSKKGDSVLRYDPKCKVCKRSERKKDAQECHESNASIEVQPTNESFYKAPLKSIVPKERLEKILGDDDLGLNSIYANSFNEFIQILREEYSRLIGVPGVYIKKTK